ncbi:hypothetical protein [Neobacillus sp. CF12]|uniref:hypothetical protein n=1 Tax=Neobacillus sp. CF12 TaxID=3055864 RepID=UPI00259FF02B|nr:hypothetical protein [Neobacillus sp. CF12]MDM5326190.1 hypothetical protein [Neobacillus sp. CF12]
MFNEYSVFQMMKLRQEEIESHLKIHGSILFMIQKKLIFITKLLFTLAVNLHVRSVN